MPEKHTKIPWFCRRILRLITERRNSSHIEASFEEIYHDIYDSKGRTAAQRWLWAHIFKSIPAITSRSIYWSFDMYKNYLKIAFRNLKKYKTYSFLNIMGLAVGMTCFILIALYVKFELSFDRYHDDAENIYRVAQVLKEGHAHGGNNLYAQTQMPLAPVLEENFPEILKYTRFISDINVNLTIDNEDFFEQEIFYADPGYFDVFTVPFISGNPETALTEPFSAVLTER
ncbi:ABC transporter permease, partial [candidate division KSB1 bacterium]